MYVCIHAARTLQVHIDSSGHSFRLMAASSVCLSFSLTVCCSPDVKFSVWVNAWDEQSILSGTGNIRDRSVACRQ